MLSNGTDVIYSVPAAHAAVSNLSRHWLVIGHSQGGLSTFGVAQLEGKRKDPNFLGTVALAGASDLEDAGDAMVSASQPVLNGLMAFLVFGVKSVYPDLELKDVLTEKALARYNAFVDDGCSAASGAFTALSPAEMFKPGWKENRYIKQFLARNRPAAEPIGGPLLIVTGGADPMFTERASQKIFDRLCAAGAHGQRNVYPGLGHDPVVYGSLKDQMGWIAARFAGEPPPSNCTSR
jgi:pimeloyl-ACP methyl ester carboxylesterase